MGQLAWIPGMPCACPRRPASFHCPGRLFRAACAQVKKVFPVLDAAVLGKHRCSVSSTEISIDTSSSPLDSTVFREEDGRHMVARRVRVHSNGRGFLYLVQTRNCVEVHQRVFKIGRCRKVSKRMAGYPKGSELISQIAVSHSVEAEAALLTLCRSTFTPRPDFGTEYFEGGQGEIMGALLSAAKLFPVEADAVRAFTEMID